jgi:hypothetical protein
VIFVDFRLTKNIILIRQSFVGRNTSNHACQIFCSKSNCETMYHWFFLLEITAVKKMNNLNVCSAHSYLYPRYWFKYMYFLHVHQMYYWIDRYTNPVPGQSILSPQITEYTNPVPGQSILSPQITEFKWVYKSSAWPVYLIPTNYWVSRYTNPVPGQSILSQQITELVSIQILWLTSLSYHTNYWVS